MADRNTLKADRAGGGFLIYYTQLQEVFSYLEWYKHPGEGYGLDLLWSDPTTVCLKCKVVLSSPQGSRNAAALLNDRFLVVLLHGSHLVDVTLIKASTFPLLHSHSSLHSHLLQRPCRLLIILLNREHFFLEVHHEILMAALFIPAESPQTAEKPMWKSV